jgi:predicted nuclease with RNAse H fold
MVYRGIKLRATLEDQGYRVIEVYPYASKVRLWGKGIPSKLKPAGIKLLQHHLATIIPSLASQVANFNHDLCDAAMAAYTAYLDSLGKTEPLGNPEEGIIFIPI